MNSIGVHINDTPALLALNYGIMKKDGDKGAAKE